MVLGDFGSVQFQPADGSKRSRNSLFISRNALASGYFRNRHEPWTSAQRLMNNPR